PDLFLKGRSFRRETDLELPPLRGEIFFQLRPKLREQPMLARHKSATKLAANRLQVAFQHPTIGKLKQADSFIGRAGEQRSKRTLQHRHHRSCARFTAPSGRLAESAAERITKATVRLEAAVEGCIIERLAVAQLSESASQSMAALP